jgi:hypothetical protein
MPRSGWPATISAISAPIEHDVQSGCGLLKGSRGLAGVQHKAPAAQAFVIHELRMKENTGSRGWREPAGLSVVKQERNVVKGCLGSRPLLRISGEIGLSTLGTGGVWFLARQLVHHLCLLDVHRHAVRRVNVKARVPVRWQIDFRHRHVFLLKHGQMVRRLFDRNRRSSSRAIALRKQPDECGAQRRNEMPHRCPRADYNTRIRLFIGSCSVVDHLCAFEGVES